jgi:hypothetical protein
MAINKFINKNISDLSKIMNVNISDLSKFMGHSVTTYVFKDTFTGANGSDPDSTYWNPDPYLKIQNNQLHGAVNNTQGYVKSKFYFVGDFDVFVSFDDLITGTTQDNRIELLVAVPGLDVASISARWRDAASIFYGFFRYDGNYFGHTQTARSNNYGALGIIRSGTTITLRYKDGGGNWTTLTSNTLGTANFIVTMAIYSMASGDVSGDFDDFIIDSGTMV